MNHFKSFEKRVAITFINSANLKQIAAEIDLLIRKSKNDFIVEYLDYFEEIFFGIVLEYCELDTSARLV